MLGKLAQSNKPVSVMAPPSALPWPLIDLVSEFITRPAPTAEGRNR